MIVLDTHIWIWWVNGSDRLTVEQKRLLEATDRIGVSAISC